MLDCWTSQLKLHKRLVNYWNYTLMLNTLAFHLVFTVGQSVSSGLESSVPEALTWKWSCLWQLAAERAHLGFIRLWFTGRQSLITSFSVKHEPLRPIHSDEGKVVVWFLQELMKVLMPIFPLCCPFFIPLPFPKQFSMLPHVTCTDFTCVLWMISLQLKVLQQIIWHLKITPTRE